MRKYIEKGFGWRRNLDYIKVNFFIMYKKLLEYKANFFLILFEQFIYILGFVLFFNVIVLNFEDVISWNFKDFLLFLIIYDFTQVFVGIFGWNQDRLNYDIKTGTLNQFLLRPIKPYFGWFFYEPNMIGVIYTMLQFIIYGIFLLFYKIEVINVFFSIIIFLLISLLFIIEMEFIKSLDLIKIGLADIIRNPYNSLFDITDTFPAPFFRNNFIKYFLFLVPYFFVGTLIIPLLRDYEIWHIEIQIFLLIFMTIIFSIGTLINWHYGLKKYEAFG